MNLKTCIQWLLDNNYAVLVGGYFVQTKKLNDELSGNAKPAEIIVNNIPTTIPEVSKTEHTITLSEKKQIWADFADRINIPHRVKTPDGSSYTIRQFSLSNANRLISIIKDPKISYDRLIESTKNYYATVTYKVMLSNYFEKDIWRSEYDNFDKIKNNTTSTDSSSRWED